MPLLPGGPAALPQLHDARRKIQLVVRDQNLFDRHLVERSHAARRPAAAIHVRHRLQQPDLLLPDANTRELALMLRLEPKRAAMPPRQLIDEPEPGVVARARVLGLRIAETNDEFERNASHNEMQRNKSGDLLAEVFGGT